VAGIGYFMTAECISGEVPERVKARILRFVDQGGG
jgi:hypothetical protein